MTGVQTCALPISDIMVYDNIVLVYMFGCLFFSEIIYMIFSSMIAPTYSEFTTMMDTPNILVDSDRSSAFTMIGITFLLIGVSGTLFVHTLNVFSEYVFYILALCCIALMILFLIRLRTAKIQTQIKPIYCGKINTVPLCFYNTPCMIIKDQKICFTDKKDHFL